MKAFVIVNNYGPENAAKEPGWYFIADSAVTNTGKPFYLPENLGEAAVSLAPAIRISRLGKYVAPKFAHRYWSEMAPAVHFYFPEYERKLLEGGLPADTARNFDRSLFVGDFQPFEETTVIEFWKNGEKVSVFSFDSLHKNINDMISRISVMNTIKMGDLLLPGLAQPLTVEIGDRLDVKIGNKEAFTIKVK